MPIAAFRYTRRVNLGNYEHEEFGFEFVPEDGETFSEEDVVRSIESASDLIAKNNKNARVSRAKRPAPAKLKRTETTYRQEDGATGKRPVSTSETFDPDDDLPF